MMNGRITMHSQLRRNLREEQKDNMTHGQRMTQQKGRTLKDKLRADGNPVTLSLRHRTLRDSRQRRMGKLATVLRRRLRKQSQPNHRVCGR
jgi:hypothetical protein